MGKVMVTNPDIPAETIENWQQIVDQMAKITKTPAGLIMRLESEDTIKVFVASKSHENKYKPGDTCPFDPGLYCENVIRRRDFLLVPDALRDLEWDKNPDLEIGMNFYLGFPLIWPDGQIFGTICVLDQSDSNDAIECKQLIGQFKKVVENDLKLLVEVAERKQAQAQLMEIKKNLESRVIDRTKRLEEVNTALKVLLHEHELTKKELESSMLANINELILPNLQKATKTQNNANRNQYLSLIESGLREITSTFSSELVQKYSNLTPTEIRVANLIRQGKKTKEIATCMNTATSTIDFHRANLRKKIGISDRSITLRSHLSSSIH